MHIYKYACAFMYLYMYVCVRMKVCVCVCVNAFVPWLNLSINKQYTIIV